MNPADNDPDWTKNIWFLREHDDLFEQAVGSQHLWTPVTQKHSPLRA